MARKSGPVLELLLAVDRRAPDALRVQVERGLREAVRAGRLRAGTPLPSSRALAGELGVSRSVIVEAYAQLCAEGYLHAREGSRTRVAATVPSTPRSPPPSAGLAPATTYDFHPGLADLAAFPIGSWMRALQRGLRRAPHAAMGYPDPRGVPLLRERLAGYLARARGAQAEPDRMLICTGIVQGLTLICQALRSQGARRIAVEDPCWYFHRACATEAGLEVLPVNVDDQGIAVTELDRLGVDAVIVTPAHQYPTGVLLSPERRTTLVQWARSKGALVIEDDYDAEYRYDGEPVGALQGLAPDHVLYAGSASKILAPGLRLGWLLAPGGLANGLARQKMHADLGSNVPAQLALACFIEDGELDRHLRRTRRTYRARRSALIDALHVHLPDAQITGIAAGLHALALMPDGTDEARLITKAAKRGVAVQGLTWHRADPAQGPPGLLLGYANLSEAAIGQGIRQLAAARADT